MDPLEIQISIRLRLPQTVRAEDVPSSLIDELVRYRIDNGYDHPRATTRIVQWLNPARKGQAAQWRTGNQADAWETLGRALKKGRIKITIV